MCKTFYSRMIFCIILSIIILSITGCPQTRFVYPENISHNAFKLSEQWAGKYITSIAVFDKQANNELSPEPVWVIKATEQVPAEELIFLIGSIPNGFEQVVPDSQEKFEPVDGQEYDIMVMIEPVENDMVFIMKSWTASGIPDISLPEGNEQSLIHPASKMEFPLYVGFFLRGVAHRYDETGNDISVAYYHPLRESVTTVYIYPAIDSTNNPIDLETHLEETKEAIKSHYYKSRMMSEGGIKIKQNDKTYKGLNVIYYMTKKTAGGSIPVFSNLYLFKYDKWFIKYRFTYPKKSKEYFEKEINKFLETLKWPDYN